MVLEETLRRGRGGRGPVTPTVLEAPSIDRTLVINIFFGGGWAEHWTVFSAA